MRAGSTSIDERHAFVHRDGQRLRAAHAAESGGHGERPAQRAAEMPLRASAASVS